MIAEETGTSLLAKLRNWRRGRRDRKRPSAAPGGRLRPAQSASWSEALRFPPF